MLIHGDSPLVVAAMETVELARRVALKFQFHTVENAASRPTPKTPLSCLQVRKMRSKLVECGAVVSTTTSRMLRQL